MSEHVNIFLMTEFVDKPKDVSYLQNELPVTRLFLQHFENKWFLAEQLRNQGKRTTLLDLQIFGLAVATVVVGIPEVGCDCAKYVVRGLVHGCNWE